MNASCRFAFSASLTGSDTHLVPSLGLKSVLEDWDLNIHCSAVLPPCVRDALHWGDADKSEKNVDCVYLGVPPDFFGFVTVETEVEIVKDEQL